MNSGLSPNRHAVVLFAVSCILGMGYGLFKVRARRFQSASHLIIASVNLVYSIQMELETLQ